MQKCEQSKTKKKLFSLKRTFKWKCSAWLNTNNKCRQTNCIYLVNKKEEAELKEKKEYTIWVPRQNVRAYRQCIKVKCAKAGGEREKARRRKGSASTFGEVLWEELRCLCRSGNTLKEIFTCNFSRTLPAYCLLTHLPYMLICRKTG